MAPAKRAFDVYSAEASYAAESYDFDASVELSMTEQLMATPPLNKRFKFTSITPPSIKKDLSTYLDFDASLDAVVPSTKYLVGGVAESAWLSDSMPGSPTPVFHELPGDRDGDTDGDGATDDSASDSDSGPATSLFGDSSASLTGAFDNHLLDAAEESMHIPTLNRLSTDHALLMTVDMGVARGTPDNDPTLLAASACAAIPQPKANTQRQTLAQRQAHRTNAAIEAKQAAAEAAEAAEAAATAEAEAAAAAVASTNLSFELLDDKPGSAGSGTGNRWAHNSTERKRRCEIRRLFSSLRDLFPDLHGDDRTSNINTLNRAITSVGELNAKAIEHEGALRALRKRNVHLRTEYQSRTGHTLPAKAAGAAAAAQQAADRAQAAADRAQAAAEQAAAAQVAQAAQAALEQQQAATMQGYSQTYPQVALDGNYPQQAAVVGGAASIPGYLQQAPQTDCQPVVATTQYPQTVESMRAHHERQAQAQAEAQAEVEAAAANAKAADEAAAKADADAARATAALVAANAAAAAQAQIEVEARAAADAETLALARQADLRARVEAEFNARCLAHQAEAAEAAAIAAVMAAQPSLEPLQAMENGALELVSAADPLLRKALPSALRQLLDHNGRGSAEILTLPRRRSTYRKF